MSEKQDKKIRQLFRKEYKSYAEMLADKDMKMFKPKPKWVPMFLWVAGMKIFLKVRN